MKRHLGALCILLAVLMILGTGCMGIVEQVKDGVKETLGSDTQPENQEEMPVLPIDREEDAVDLESPSENAPENYEEGDSEWMWGDLEEWNALLCDFSHSAYEVNDCTVMECTLDLDDDGEEEFHIRVGEGYEEHQLYLSDDGVEYESYFGEGHLELTRAMAADIVPNDGVIEIFVSGDWASADYVTFAWCYDGEQLIEIADAELGYASGTYGEINGFDKDLILLRRDMDIMGTWWGEQAYMLTYQSGAPTNLNNSEPAMVKIGPWMHTDPLYEKDPLVVAKDLNVVGAGGQGFTVYAGETLEILSVKLDSDHYDVIAALADGSEVSLTVEIRPVDDWHEFYINGKPEGVWFEELPYSG